MVSFFHFHVLDDAPQLCCQFVFYFIFLEGGGGGVLFSTQLSNKESSHGAAGNTCH